MIHMSFDIGNLQKIQEDGHINMIKQISNHICILDFRFHKSTLEDKKLLFSKYFIKTKQNIINVSFSCVDKSLTKTFLVRGN